jgi:uncharacterized protein
MKPLPTPFCRHLAVVSGVLMLAAGCASRQHDHFYVLDAQPAGARESRTQFNRQVTLRVTVPSLNDRSEMVWSTPNGVTVLDHERWAAPLPDLVTATLAEDLERRRADVVVLPRSSAQVDIPMVKIVVEIDQLTARVGGQVGIETHWRLTDARSGKVLLGRDSFTAAERPENYTGIAAALSSCIGLLADRLVREIPVE